MKKRGVSPLIASVLLIAFVIILFVLITTWAKRAAVEPSMQTGEEKIASSLECAELSIKIVDVCKDGDDLKATVENMGTKELYGVKIRAISEDGVDVKEFKPLNIESLGRSSALVIGNAGDVSEIEVYPMTTTGICQGQFVSTSVIADSC